MKTWAGFLIAITMFSAGGITMLAVASFGPNGLPALKADRETLAVDIRAVRALADSSVGELNFLKENFVDFNTETFTVLLNRARCKRADFASVTSPLGLIFRKVGLLCPIMALDPVTNKTTQENYTIAVWLGCPEPGLFGCQRPGNDQRPGNGSL